jgi:bifunctional DNA-binding transcriptional regulator/antitoxin component of YhaV-PrlF toxin-antitoxin module
VVIPQALRQKLGISRGDVLEAKVERGQLTYTPKVSAVGRIPADKAGRERFFKQLPDEAPTWLKEAWAASRRNGTDKLTMRQINAEVAAVRRQRAKKISDRA